MRKDLSRLILEEIPAQTAHSFCRPNVFADLSKTPSTTNQSLADLHQPKLRHATNQISGQVAYRSLFHPSESRNGHAGRRRGRSYVLLQGRSGKTIRSEEHTSELQ